MWDYLAIFSSESSVIDSLQSKHSTTGNVKVKEDGPLKDHLPFDFNQELQDQVVFVSPLQERGKHEDFIDEIFKDLFSNDQDHVDNVVLRFDSSSGELKSVYKEKEQPLNIQEEFSPGDHHRISTRIMEKCGKYDLDHFNDIKGVLLEQIEPTDKVLLAHGKQTNNIYTTSTEIIIDNVEHTIQSEGRLILKEEDNEIIPKVKPVYKELQIPTMMEELYKKEDIDKLIDNEISHLKFQNPSNPNEAIFAFFDFKRNKIVLEKDKELAKDLTIKAASKEQSHLILNLSIQEKQSLCELKSVKVNKSFNDIDGGTYTINVTLEPKIDFIRKELSFTQKTLRQDQNLLKKNKPSL